MNVSGTRRDSASNLSGAWSDPPDIAWPGILPVAEDYVLVARDPCTGRGRVNGRMLVWGTAAGLLADLLLAGHLGLGGRGTLRVRDPCREPADPVDRALWDNIAKEPGTDLDRWLERTADTSVVLAVTRRMVVSGRLTRGEMRRGIRRIPVLMPTDLAEAQWRTERLSVLLPDCERISEADLTLLSIAEATGLLAALGIRPQTGARTGDRRAVAATCPTAVTELLRDLAHRASGGSGAQDRSPCSPRPTGARRR